MEVFQSKRMETISKHVSLFIVFQNDVNDVELDKLFW